MFEVDTAVKEAQLLYPSNMVILNYRLIKRYGAEGALLLSMLLSMEAEATLTKKLFRDDDGTKYFQINKKYITAKTGLGKAAQNDILKELEASKVLKFKGDMHDIVHIDTMGLITLLTIENEDFDTRTTAARAAEKVQKQEKTLVNKSRNLLKKTSFTNPKVVEALGAWLNMMIVERHENLTEESLRIAEKLLKDACEQEDEKMVEIINETTGKRWRSFSYVINNMSTPSTNQYNNRNRKYEDPTIDATVMTSNPVELSDERY